MQIVAQPMDRRAALRRLGAGTAAAACVLFAAPAAAAPLERSLAPAEAQARAEAGALLLVDVRRPAEWRETGVPEPAREITLHHEDGAQGFLDAMLAAVDGDRSRPVALICATGGRSGWAGRFLAENGFETVYNVQEGVLGRGEGTGWARRGLPMRGCRICAAQ
ncbi:MAG: rhodanese-like domain-containing protein [Alphaproteobacteria bacterium]|nr:rhodanese-like domain-containing protein [Alphaproteobacteria bacterium]